MKTQMTIDETMAMQAALQVLVYTVETNEFLQENDPEALKQALEALGIANPYNHRPTTMFRNCFAE